MPDGRGHCPYDGEASCLLARPRLTLCRDCLTYQAAVLAGRAVEVPRDPLARRLWRALARLASRRR